MPGRGGLPAGAEKAPSPTRVGCGPWAVSSPTRCRLSGTGGTGGTGGCPTRRGWLLSASRCKDAPRLLGSPTRPGSSPSRRRSGDTAVPPASLGHHPFRPRRPAPPPRLPRRRPPPTRGTTAPDPPRPRVSIAGVIEPGTAIPGHAAARGPGCGGGWSSASPSSWCWWRGAGYAYYLTHDLNRIHVRGLVGALTSGKEAGTENILMVGSTSRCALTVQNAAYGLCSEGVNGVNSDVIMILHVDPAHHHWPSCPSRGTCSCPTPGRRVPTRSTPACSKA